MQFPVVGNIGCVGVDNDSVGWVGKSVGSTLRTSFFTQITYDENKIFYLMSLTLR